MPDAPVAPTITTVPSRSTSASRVRSGSHDDMPGFIPPATCTARSSVPAGSAKRNASGTAMRSAMVPNGAATLPV